MVALLYSCFEESPMSPRMYFQSNHYSSTSNLSHPQNVQVKDDKIPQFMYNLNLDTENVTGLMSLL